MKVNLAKEGQNIVKLGVEIEPDKALKEYEVACRKISHRVNIPGFRKGKAPRPIIEKAVGVNSIKQEALEHLVPEILGRVIFDEKLDLITEPTINSYEFELGEPLKLNLTLEIRPEVVLGSYQGISVKVNKASLSEDALQKRLEAIAEAKATFQTSPESTISVGDKVLMDFECFVDGAPIEGGLAKGLLLEIKEGNFLTGFCEQLVDKQAGTSCKILARFPENYRNPELKGKEGEFTVHIREVRKRVIPEINDELAKLLGQESLESLKTVLQQLLTEEIQQENTVRVQKAVVEAAVANAQVEIPDTMVDRECNLSLAYLKRHFEQNGQSWQEFTQTSEYENLYKEKREEATKRILRTLVLGAIVRAENISISEEEIAPYLAELVAGYNVPIEQAKYDKQVERMLEELKQQAGEEALGNKVVQLLLQDTQVEYV